MDERAQQGHERLRDERADTKSQARSDQTQMIQNNDQTLEESSAQATRESEKRFSRMTRESERLFNDQNNMYTLTMTNLEKILDAKTGHLMQKLD